MILEKDVIEALRKEAESNRIAREVFVVFATRERARSIVTVDGLEQRMKINGFPNNSKEDYANVLKFLANLGLGKLMTKVNGKVLGLRDVKIKLQSIGEVACNKVAKLEGFHTRNTYHKLDVPKQSLKPKILLPEKKADITIKVDLGSGIKYEVHIPKEATIDEITTLIKRLI